MFDFLISIIIAGLFLFAVLVKTKTRQNNWKYKKKPALTETETKFFWRLKNACPDHVILAQVAMSAIFEPATSSKKRIYAFRQISQKVMDFVICDRTFNVLAAIELDDWTHSRPDRQKSDRTKNEIFSDTRIPLIRFDAQQMSDTETIRQRVKSVTEAPEPEGTGKLGTFKHLPD